MTRHQWPYSAVRQGRIQFSYPAPNLSGTTQLPPSLAQCNPSTGIRHTVMPSASHLVPEWLFQIILRTRELSWTSRGRAASIEKDEDGERG